jgi:hypothetical protein
LRVALSGKPTHHHLFRGKPFPKKIERPEAGFIFFTEEGTECSGLTFSGNDGGQKDPVAGGILTMDAYEQDQVVTFRHGQSGESRGSSLVFQERPFTPLVDLIRRSFGWRRWVLLAEFLLSPGFRRRMKEDHAVRLRLGRDHSGDVGLVMNDSKGRERIRLVVDSTDTAKLEFLDEAGNVTFKLPPD